MRVGLALQARGKYTEEFRLSSRNRCSERVRAVVLCEG